MPSPSKGICIRGPVHIFGIVFIILLVCVLKSTCNFVQLEDIGFDEESPFEEANAIQGGSAFLPCDVTSPTGDSPLLVLFFRGAEPIYSVDARQSTLSKALHWTSKNMNAKKPYFELHNFPHGLRIESLESSDAGDYHCRVDFKESPTRNTRVRLNVAVPPSRISIVDHGNKEVHGTIGPYPLGDTVSLTCNVEGGTPPPVVTWWHNGSLLDDEMEQGSPHVVSNTLTIPNLVEHHLLWNLVCQAINSNITSPVTASVQIDMTFPPSEITIDGAVQPRREGITHELVCRTSGSRPRAQISWFMNGNKIDGITQMSHYPMNNSTRSTLSLTLTREMNGVLIACRAENTNMIGRAIEVLRKLIVHYSPQTILEAGANINLDDVREGSDVYFECRTEANPRVFRVEWLFNNEKVHPRSGVLFSNQSLVLQKVNRSLSGQYRCKAANTIASHTSNTINLSVKYSPVCFSKSHIIYARTDSPAVNVSCEAGGQPEPVSFRWALNNTQGIVDISRSQKFHHSSGRSILFYRPKERTDFGTVLCWGENALGIQREPCVFRVLPAQVPDQVEQCTISKNSSFTAVIHVVCQPGWNGGLEQKFTLEIHLSSTEPALASLSNELTPSFSVVGLPPGTEFQLIIQAHNPEGSSDPTLLTYFMPIDIAEERQSAMSEPSMGGDRFNVTGLHLIGVGVGVLIVMGLSCAVVWVVGRNRSRKQDRQPKALPQITTEVFKNEGLYGELMETPDVILVSGENSLCEKGNIDNENRQLFENAKRHQRNSVIHSPSHECEVLLPETAIEILSSAMIPTVKRVHFVQNPQDGHDRSPPYSPSPAYYRAMAVDESFEYLQNQENNVQKDKHQDQGQNQHQDQYQHQEQNQHQDQYQDQGQNQHQYQDQGQNQHQDQYQHQDQCQNQHQEEYQGHQNSQYLNPLLPVEADDQIERTASYVRSVYRRSLLAQMGLEGEESAV